MKDSVPPAQLAVLTAAAADNPPKAEYLGKHIVLYDGICSYCKGIMDASHTSDQRDQFFFSPLQSPFAQKALGQYGIDSLELRSMYVISDYGTSNEAVRAGAPASNFLLLGLSGELRDLGMANSQKPREIQDTEYKAVAATRYDTHPKLAEIFVPPGDERRRYLF